MSLSNMTKVVALGALLLGGCMATQPTPAPSCPGAVATPVTPEVSARARAGAEKLIQDAVAQKRWMTRDRLALQQTLPALTPCDRAEVLQALAKAIDSDALKPDEGAFPPF